MSLGSKRLTRWLQDPASGFSRCDEKYLGDLVIKIVEHFVPLFVGTYSAAPYRIDFCDFHPEKLMGFLPHELDYTHLRMIWRRWKNKAKLKVCGTPFTPFGPQWFDKIISSIFRLKGDLVPDFRLIDYFVALMSTEKSPALDGQIGNGERLKQDLAALGVFDSKMALYLPYRMRECHVMGFSGFEGRIYSLFETHAHDMGNAVNLQNLITALAFKYVVEGKLSHAQVLDIPFIESERRQVFFGTAIGIPTFFVHKNTRNAFLKRVLERTARIRPSRRYPGYLQVYNVEYRKAVLRLLREDAADLVAMLQLEETLNDLERRLCSPERHSVSERLTQAILGTLNKRSATQVGGTEFNQAAEQYYHEQLRLKQLEEAFDFLREDAHNMLLTSLRRGLLHSQEFHLYFGNSDAGSFIAEIKPQLLKGTVSSQQLKKLVHLVLLSVHFDMEQAQAQLDESRQFDDDPAPIHRAAHG